MIVAQNDRPNKIPEPQRSPSIPLHVRLAALLGATLPLNTDVAYAAALLGGRCAG